MFRSKLLVTLILTLCLVFLAGGNALGSELAEYEMLYKAGKYEEVITRLLPIVQMYESGKKSNLTETTAINARNLIADSYRMLGKYTQAANWYGGTVDGYFDPYASYYFQVLRRVAVIVDEPFRDEGSGPEHYEGWLGSKPLHENVLGEILVKLLDDVALSRKQQYLRELVSYDKDGDWVTELTRFCAGDLAINELISSVPQKFLGTAYTYAGLSMEIAGNIVEARKLYERALAQKDSTNIELLLAANRLGQFALKMVYTKEEPIKGYTVISLSDIYAAKASSAKLEEDRLYSVRQLIDGDKKTAWVPAGDNGGIGEWVEFSFDEPRYIKTLQLVNGYAKSDTSFSRNNRVKVATLSFSDGTMSQISLEDTPLKQTVPIGKKVQSVKFTIDDVYKGTAYDDTCLSEIELEF